MSVEQRIHNMAERWFLSEPAIFSVYCIHHLQANTEMTCPVRVGKGFIEYDPYMLDDMSDMELEQHFRAEMIRVLLKHPYGRQPERCAPEACKLGSDCVVKEHYLLSELPMLGPLDLGLDSNQTYEEYARLINGMMPDDSMLLASGNGDSTALWQEDAMVSETINNLIKNTKNWGSIPANMVERIIASTKARIDYRKVLQGFRASILSSKRKLTRMRPNRRSGFEQMGSKYDFNTRMLVAVDVSGSVSSHVLEHFFTLINKAFRYGIQQIDVLQFDTELKGEPVTMKKATPQIKIIGRGGTNFQPVIDYVANNPYDGLIIMTDGYAPQPSLPPHFSTPLLWVCQDRSAYDHNAEWMAKLGRVMMMEV